MTFFFSSSSSRALLLDFTDEQKPDKKSKKKITDFFDKSRSDNEDSDEVIGGNGSGVDDDDDDASDIDMEITWQPGLKGKKENTKSKKTINHRQAESDEDEIDNEQDELNDNDRETLQLLADDDDDIDGKRDFNLRDLVKSHKQTMKAAAKNAKKSKKLQQNLAAASKKTNDNFQLNVNDKRFQAVFNQAAFNIDQSDPHFKATAGTQQLIDEKLKKRKLDNVNFSSSRTDRDEDDLVVKLKRKTAKKD